MGTGRGRDEERARRFRWEKGDVKIYKNLDELKKAAAAEGKVFIPARGVPEGNAEKEGAE